MDAEEERIFPTAQELKIYREVERFMEVCHAHKIADCRTCGEEKMDKCKFCGLIQGHANSCYAHVLIEKVLAFEQVVERAKILLEAPTEHAKSVAAWKLKDAIAELDRIERRQSVKVR